MAFTILRAFATAFLLVCLLPPAAISQPGSNDPTFNPNDVGGGNGDGFFPYDAYVSLIQPDGKIILSGEFQTYNGSGPSYFVRLNPDGSRDGTFLMGSGPDRVNSMAAAPTGDILLGGLTVYDGVPIPNQVARIHADGTLDPTFQSAAGADGFVAFVAVQPDGKVIVAGGETIAQDTSVLWVGRLNTDGSMDTSFTVANAFDTTDANNIRSLALTTDGKVLIAGYFSAFNGVPVNNMIRLNADGTMDAGFDPGSGPNSEVWAIAVRSDNKTLLAGLFNAFDGAPHRGLVQLNVDGSVDTTFDIGTGFTQPVDAGSDAQLYSILLQPDGKALVGGLFDTLNGEALRGLVRLNMDGSNDTSYDTGLGCTGSIYTMSLDQDGSIVAAGTFEEYDGFGIGNIARIASDGSPVTSFNPGTGFYIFTSGIYDYGTSVSTLAMQADGSFYAAGLFKGYNGVPRNLLVHVLADGAVDNTFDPGVGFRNDGPGYPAITSLMVQDDGKLIVGGRFDSYNGNACGNIARLNTDGSFDPTFTAGTGFGTTGGSAAWVDYLASQAGGKVVVSGPFSSYNGDPCNGTVQLNSDGTLDLGFAPVNYIRGALAVQPDGKVIVDGQRLDLDGSNDLSWGYDGISNNGTVGELKCVALQSDGRLLIGGWFTHVGPVPRNGFARLNADGTLDLTFDPGSGVGGLSDGTRAIVVQNDDRIVIGGLFAEYNGIPRQGIARVESDGALDVSFDPGSGFGSLPELGGLGFVTSLAIQPGSKVIAGGFFTSYNGIGRNRIARIHTDFGTGLLSQHASTQRFYPNPAGATATLLLNLPPSASVNLLVVDARGRTVLEINGNSGPAFELDLRTLPAGAYTYQATSGGQRFTGTFVKG